MTASRSVSWVAAMAWRWESHTGKKPARAVEKRWAHSCARIMDPPCPMHSTLSAARSRSAALRIFSGRMRLMVWAAASMSAA